MFRSQINESVADVRLVMDDPRDIKTRIDATSDELRRCELVKLIEFCEAEINELRLHLSKVSDGKLQWAEWIRKLPATQRPSAEQEFDVFDQTIDNELLTRAKQHVRQLDKVKSTFQFELNQVEIYLKQSTQMPVPNLNSTRMDTIKLPTIQLEKFNGNRVRWLEFFENFKAAVDGSNMSNVQKMTYLRTLLTGEARNVIDGLSLTDVNYNIAIDLLKERFGNQDEIVRQLYHEISALKICRSFDDCKEFADKLESLCRQLEAMGESVESRLLYLSLEQKLSKPMLRNVLEEKEKQRDWNTTEFRRTLRKLLSKEEALNRVLEIQNVETKGVAKEMRKTQLSESSMAFTAPVRDLAANNGTFPRCPTSLFQKTHLSAPKQTRPATKCRFCEQTHWAAECTVYCNDKARYERAKELRLCFKCLSKDHLASKCVHAKPCWYCKQAHHQALCSKKFGQCSGPAISTMASIPSSEGRVLLMTASAILVNPNQPQLSKKVVVFFDTGAHRSYITKEVAEWLKLRVEKESDSTICKFGSDAPINYHRMIVSAKLKVNDKDLLPLKLDIVDTIISVDIPMAIVNDKGMEQCDVSGEFVKTATSTRKPDVLIGIDQKHYFEIATKKKLENGYFLSDSIIGPIVSGESIVQSTTAEQQTVLFSTYVINDKVNKSDDLFNIVQDYYELEKAGLEEDIKEDENIEILQTFNKSLKLMDNRYEVSLPWKTPFPGLDCNYWMAHGRLKSTIKMLKRRPELLEQYNKTMMEQLNKGIIEKVPLEEVENGSIIHYLPHQAVVREDKLHTKLRIVYDGSAKTIKNGNSINQCLHRGPLLLRDFVGILLRFRVPAICVVADIEKAFLQLSLKPEDRDACRFLWPEDPRQENWQSNLNVYRFCRVTFGLICSPFLLAATIEEHLQREGSALAKNMKDNIYVDNIVIHQSSSSDTLKACLQAKNIFSKISMNLREFASNDRDAISKLDEEDRVPTTTVKILGLKWDTDADVFQIKMCFDIEESESKRSVLKKIASAFDPMGWMVPAMLSAKKFFQCLWKEKLEWDEKLNDKMLQNWQQIGSTWNEEIRIARRLFDTESKEMKLHVFSDASKDAFGAAAYLSIKGHRARLIYAKCRINSLKSKATIPMLELTALKTAAQLVNFLVKQIQVTSVQLWTDSQCVIHWLNSTSKLDRYVENRVKVIREYNVNFVATEDNPADLITRGMTFAQLKVCDKWWYGPSWLSNDVMDRKMDAPSYEPAKYNCQKSTEDIFHTFCSPVAKVACSKKSKESVVNLSRFSTWRKAIRTTAYVLRFLKIIRKQRTETSSILTVAELHNACVLLVREAQQRDPPTKDAKNNLEMFQDDKQIWRCRGRIGESQADESSKKPIWLPKNDCLTNLVVIDAHEKTFHAGTNTTLSLLRRKFWLSQGRRRIKSIVRGMCVTCRKYLVTPYKLPKMPDLPEARVTRSRPFEHTGLDYFGPISTRQTKGAETSKIWACLFTCFATRAIHVEVVLDLSAEAFMLSFNRFISRRGTPKTIMSDNGTNFKLASKVIQDTWREVITDKRTQDDAASKGIVWKFIAERAPWRGGFWERLIGIIKSALKKTIGRKIFIFDELHTLLTQIELIVNQRPLTFQSDEEDTIPLRPIDFIIPYDLSESSPVAEYTEDSDPTYYDQTTNRDKLVHSFQLTLQRINKFWKIWSNEYLLALRERQKTLDFKQNKTSTSKPLVGEVVLVQENDMPRNSWRLACIKELIPGADGLIRTARIKVGDRITTRAINVLYPLELSTSTQVNQESQDIFKKGTKAQAIQNETNEVNICFTVASFQTTMEEIILDIETDDDENCECEADTATKHTSSSHLAEVKSTTTVDRIQCEADIATKHSSSSHSSRKVGIASMHTSTSRGSKGFVTNRPKPKQRSSGNHNPIYRICTSTWSISTDSKTGWEVMKTCEKHHDCPGLIVSDIYKEGGPKKRNVQEEDKVINPVPTLWHAFFLRWAIRLIHNESSSAKIAAYVFRMFSSPATELVTIHEEMREEVISVAKNPKAVSPWFDKRDAKAVFKLWQNTCKTAMDNIGTESWKSVKVTIPSTIASTEDGRKFLEGIAGQLSQWLTVYRHDMFHPTTTMVFASCLILGDELMKGAVPKVKGIKIQDAELKATNDVFRNLYLMPSVKVVVISTGLSVVKGEHTSDSYRQCLQEIDKTAQKHGDINWFLIPPPEFAYDLERSRRVQQVVRAKWKQLKVVAGPKGINVWGRAFTYKRELPTIMDYGRVFAALVAKGVPLDMSNVVVRDPLEVRVQRLFDRFKASSSGVGSVADASKI